MTDHCEKCGRFVVATHYPDVDDCSQDFGGSTDPVCHLIHDAYRRGLREGVELAKDLLWDDPPDCYWRDVDAELERRLK